MSTERFLRLQDLFEQALVIPAERRAAWCDAHAGADDTLRRELLRLLERNDRLHDSPTERPAGIAARAIEACSDSQRMPERRIGRYLLQEEIGRGGMGRVFRAERIEPGLTQEVAIKIVRREVLSDPVLRRFLLERQLLAALNHPGIARLLDAGEAADGTPFVAMELVRGEPLPDYCARHALGCPQRLVLFRQVLAAVAHAHRNLVVHRDIKPGNVLVDGDGRIKLLDFGIAKALAAADDTATTERFLTPAYAAPEQLAGATASVAADVYSLGALLYELLSGRPPFELQGRSAAAAERLIMDTPPPPLERAIGSDPPDAARRLGIADAGAWRRQMRGDLDYIVQRALRKEPQQRYLSVEQFDADIERYLLQRPVLAAGTGHGYRLRKFVRRNRLVAAVTTVAASGLLVAFTLALRQAQIARVERDRSQAALSVLRDSFKAADPLQLSGGALSARQVLDAASRTIDAMAQEQPSLHGELTAEIAEVRLALGMKEAGDPAMQQALRWAESRPEETTLAQRLRLLDARRLVAAHALKEADAALAQLEADAPERADVLSVRAHYWQVAGQPERAIPLAHSALRTLATDSASLAYTEAAWQLAEAQRRADHSEDALATLDALLDAQRRVVGDAHPRVLVTRLRRVQALLSLQLDETAADESTALLDVMRRHFAEDSSVLALMYATHAAALSAVDRHADAARADESAAEAYERSLGAQHENTIRSRFNAAQTLAYLKAEPARVDRQFIRAIEGASQLRGASTPLVTFFRIEYARVLAERGALGAARDALLPAGGEPDLTAVSAVNLANYRALLERLFGPLRCSGKPTPTDIEDPARDRAALLYCRSVPMADGQG